MNIIGDIAGQYETFLALLKKMPDDEVLSVGDMVDRGPKSKQVIDWFMKNGKALLGNHEHMMVDDRRRGGIYDPGTWSYNGAGATLKSFGMHIPDEVLDWVEGLPMYVDLPDVFISHSFVYPGMTIQEATKVWNKRWYQIEDSILWNRSLPRRMPDKFQIAGHNSQFGLRKFADDNGDFAICIDDSRHQALTGIHWPSMQVFQQTYIDMSPI